MHLAERAFDACRIYAAALPAPGSLGFHAAVVVKTERAVQGKRLEVFRDERLSDGRVWMSPEGALEFALEVGQAAVSAQRVLTLSMGRSLTEG
jgi:hypothetical protein